MDHGWDLPLTLDLVCHINNTGFVLLGIVEHFSVNEKGELLYKEERNSRLLVPRAIRTIG